MTTPPTILPSPAPSSSSTYPQSQQFAHPNHLRTHSSSQPPKPYSNGDYPYPQNTPQQYEQYESYDYPEHQSHYPQHNYLQPVSSSPPPHTPLYIPPPQHALPPDPIHMNGGSWGYGRPPPPQAVGYQGYRPDFAGRGYMGVNGSRPDSRDRDRRRNREREDSDDRDGREDEVISTIFVVGFPDDMGEREFQNIFTFSPGFEAATLKFPSGSLRREPHAALLAELTQYAASQSHSNVYGDIPTAPLEDALSALQMGGTTSTSTSTTPSAQISLTPSQPSTSQFANHPHPVRRQTIGFARFKSRGEALAAKEYLQGRKIDSLTGSTLKAEMAKKNLHTKRTTSGEEIMGFLLRSGKLAGLVKGREGWAGDLSGGGEGERAYPYPPQGYPAQNIPIPYQNPPFSPNVNSAPPQPHTQYAPPSNPNLAQTPSTTSQSPPNPTLTSPPTRPTDSKALLALAEEADDLEDWNASPTGYETFAQTQTQTRTGSIPITHNNNPNNYHHQRPSISHSLSSTGVLSPVLSSGAGTRGIDRDREMMGGFNPSVGAGAGFGSSPPGSEGFGAGNPADQNPPINTLYVGNLPAMSPPTHPPNFLEESLRALFSRCQGFKRMSFRQKINGPMCFVEFEEVGYASAAIRDLYGHNLGGLVKGGIRLSYSKNSLGQRGASHPTGINTSLFGGIAHTVALAGMSSPSNTSPAPGAQSQPQYGLQLTSPPPSAPIPMSDHRRGSESIHNLTSLSPTAQPFNVPLPLSSSASPRSRYFGTSPSNTSTENGGGSGGGGGIGGKGFSPVSSPIRTPASFSWVSSSGGGSGGSGYGGSTGGGYGGFDPFSGGGGQAGGAGLGMGMGSLGGAASAWSQGNGH